MGNIKRAVTKVDCQPMIDGGVLVFVLGQLQAVGCPCACWKVEIVLTAMLELALAARDFKVLQ